MNPQEQLKFVRDWFNDESTTEKERVLLLEMCPELKTDKDELTRKSIVALVYEAFDKKEISSKEYNDICDYLERHKGQPSPKFKVGDMVRDTNHTRQPIYKIVYIDKECYVCESNLEGLGDAAVMHFAFDNPYLRLVEQEPAEWSEDELDAIEQAIMALEQRYDPANNGFVGHKLTFHEAALALKSLCPHWKPSEEQMEALKNSAYGTYQNGDGPALRELYNGLKKLM